MDAPFRPLLTTADWNEEWKALQVARAHPDDASAWDERSKTFATKHGPQSTYVDRFLQLAGIAQGESVLDMGCGTGALACPLACAGNRVTAADFSSGMLAQLKAQLEQQGIEDLVDIVHMSWEDDWQEHGVGPESVDVAIASRSIATADLRSSLRKLSHAARRRACITLPVASSPRIDARLLRAAGLESQLGRDFLYAFNILAADGYAPEVAYIPSTRYESFDTPDEASEQLRRIVAGAAEGFIAQDALDAALSKLDSWVRDNLVPNENAGREDGHGAAEKALRLAQARQVTWAFLAWETH